ncbi:hypothetical protein CDAR_564121 [Caerostris darwini]|uniref:Uncharacterized protein n=1 Tax=Caerostris darwini TaxID=1538125 RepID=A0AAV4M6X6_9ARAC|nr:hypothetical protein CDAR_564121 [Caerostris darwini]
MKMRHAKSSLKKIEGLRVSTKREGRREMSPDERGVSRLQRRGAGAETFLFRNRGREVENKGRVFRDLRRGCSVKGRWTLCSTDLRVTHTKQATDRQIEWRMT